MIRKSFFLVVVALGILPFIAISVANAQSTGTLNYSPTPNNLNDLDHHSLYTWKLKPTVPNMQAYQLYFTGATLTITNIRNWNSGANVLHLHLLDSAINSGVASFVDDDPAHSTVSDLTDDFTSTRYHNGKDATGASSAWLLAAGTGDTWMASPSFTTTGVNYTYAFTTSNLTTLNQYYWNSGDIALGFDPDCHLYNDGVKLTLNYKTNVGGFNASGSAVPEANGLMVASAFLLPLGAMLWKRRNRS